MTAAKLRLRLPEPQEFGRVTGDDRIVRNVPRDHGAGTNDGVSADVNARKNAGVHADVSAETDSHRECREIAFRARQIRWETKESAWHS